MFKFISLLLCSVALLAFMDATRDIGTGGIFMGYHLPHRNVMVLGNIYENPELLKV